MTREMCLLLFYKDHHQRRDTWSRFFDGLNYGKSVAKRKNNGLSWKKNTKGVILGQTGTRMAKIKTDWK